MTASNSARILIVEDEDLVRDYTKSLVSQLGYEVVAAVPLARQALDLLAADERIDLLLTDMVMPGGINGRQLAETALGDRPDLAILIVSGFDEDPDDHDPAPAARVGFLRKPFRRRELAESLSTLLGR